METEEKEIKNETTPILEKRKDKIKNWLKNPYNLTLIIILIAAFAIRFYYFWLTQNQPLWWDEAEYMSAAKNYAGLVDYKLGGIRSPGFPLLMSAFFIIGLTSEPLIRFFGLFIPSIILILLTYFMISEMYSDRKIALISTAIMIVLWENLFYSNRFHTENFALIFEFLAIFIFFRSYFKKKNIWILKPKYSLFFVILFSLLSVFFRPGNLIFIPAIILFFLILNQSAILGRKYRIITLGIVIILIVSFFMIWPKISNHPIFQNYYQPQNPICIHCLTVFNGFYESLVPWLPPILFYAFILGLILFLLEFFISYERIKKINNTQEDLGFKSDIFNFLVILFVLSFFVFFMKPIGVYEFRWFFPLLPGMLVFTSKGAIVFSEYAGSFLNNKKISIILIILISILGIYAQYYHADSIIKNKIPSYQQVKDSGLWLKENSNSEDIIISASQTQHTYYSERKIENFHDNGIKGNETLFNENLKKLKPKYIVISAFEPGFTPQWAYDWPQRHNDSVEPVKAYFFDEQQKQVALVIYRFK